MTDSSDCRAAGYHFGGHDIDAHILIICNRWRFIDYCLRWGDAWKKVAYDLTRGENIVAVDHVYICVVSEDP